MGSSLALVGQTDAADKMLALAQELFDVRKGFDDGTISADVFKAKIIDIDLRSQDLMDSLDSIDGAQFSGVISRIGGITSALQSAINKSVELLRTMPGGGAEMTTGTGLTNSGDPYDLLPPGLGSVSSSPRPNAPGVDSKGDFDAAVAAASASSGGGGGIKDLFAQRLEALQEGLATEAEVVAEWYLAGQTTLEDALAKKMLTETEYRDLRERLEKEHQQRLGRIREMGNQWGVQAALDGGAEILGAMASTNKRAAKLQGIFAAASALMSTYKGAAKELENGTLGFATAAAVIAKGIGFVAAIKSASSVGGGGGSAGGGGGGGQASAPPPPPPQQRSLTLIGDSFNKKMVIQVAEFLNDGTDNGLVLRGSR